MRSGIGAAEMFSTGFGKKSRGGRVMGRMKFGVIARGLFHAALLSSSAQSAPDGAALFATNCSACHQLDQAVVGPSLAEIRGLYLKKPNEFVKWCVAPGKKRPGAIEMPSMVHIGEPGLRAIHAHILAVAAGVKAKKEVAADPFANSPGQMARPRVQRIFLPNSSPASIAVALNETISLCWDAGPCRLRYAWTGGFIDGYPYWKGNGGNLASLVGTVRYTEAAPLFKGEAKFRGYRIQGGLPVFRYVIGTQEISETLGVTPGADGITRHFTLSPPPAAALVLEIPAGSHTTTCDQGTLSGSRLILTPEQAGSFTLTHRFQ